MSEGTASVAHPEPSTTVPSGPGRLFTLLYGIFAVGATSRSAVQLIERASHAPVAYGLSALAALVYVVGFVLLLRWGHPGSRRAMRVLCLVELTGVLVVGTLSVARTDLFPDATVWSNFGMGYLFLPAILPILVLRWLKRTAPTA
ncbi:hypothetical protein BJY21_002652 [Kineosphaera limosa]|uniref:Integral membrane protein n=1 Tax=Kineosphaera limosa NBRC 100340 TaxID=1184609 RepID=K6VGA4_9MICO|nr:hypothetical protein [Kineosphaera limosa]NYE01468.1 hypothetical protein [Kineosphaera limosa]GAB95213.1 hypothetical protein KILIM_017_00580 [Kineosphaera limosa NBRC 100340]